MPDRADAGAIKNRVAPGDAADEAPDAGATPNRATPDEAGEGATQNRVAPDEGATQNRVAPDADAPEVGVLENRVAPDEGATPNQGATPNRVAPHEALAAPKNLLTEWTRLFVGGLVKAGLREVVLSPGARSTPLVFAAHAQSEVRVHVVRDERAAGFFALGLARASERPVGLVCTSGSAPGHYLPAVMEAKADGLPLVVITADRPFELHGMAAPQTVDQARLFGGHAVDFVDLGMPDPHPAALAGLRRVAAQAFARARFPVPGAVHVNVRARKPLEPQVDMSPAGQALTQEVDRQLEAPAPRLFSPFLAPHAAGVEALLDALSRARRPLIVAGPRRASARRSLERARAEAAFAFAARLGAPLLAEASSQLSLRPCPAGVTRVAGYDRILLAPAARRGLAPDLVIQIGGPPTSAALLRALAEWDAPRWLLTERGWPDMDNRAIGVLHGRLEVLLRALEAGVAPAPAAFAPKWRDADLRSRAAGVGAAWGEGAAVDAAIASTPQGAAVMLGNSLSIRHVETWGRPGHDFTREVVVQRGLNGIDGLLAGAAGWVRGRGAGLTLVLGDVSLLHDVSSLELAVDLPAPLVVVVVDNAGGRIFERLPLAKGAGEAMSSFTTTPRVDIEGLAEAYGAVARRAHDVHEVASGVARAHRTTGVTLIRALVSEDEATTSFEALKREMNRVFEPEEEDA